MCQHNLPTPSGGGGVIGGVTGGLYKTYRVVGCFRICIVEHYTKINYKINTFNVTILSYTNY